MKCPSCGGRPCASSRSLRPAGLSRTGWCTSTRTGGAARADRRPAKAVNVQVAGTHEAAEAVRSSRPREIHRPAVKALLLSKLGEASAQGLREGSAKRKHKRLARGSVRSILHTLSGILSEAVEDRLIAANPIRGLWKTLSRGAKKTAEQTKAKALDARQAAAFLTAAEKHALNHYPYFCTLMLSGLRPSEGLAVTADRIDLRGRSLLVDRQVGQHGGLKSTKTGEERSVDLSAHLAYVLGALIERRDATHAKVVPITGAMPASDDAGSLSPWLFYPELGEKPTRKDAQRVYKNALRAMRRSLEAAGLPTHHGLHALRHTYGSGLVRGGSPGLCPGADGTRKHPTDRGHLRVLVPSSGAGGRGRLGRYVRGGRGHLMDTTEDSEAALGR